MRTFVLVRTEDVSGISGTGIVAEGVEFSDGSVSVRWLNSGVSEANKARGVEPTTVIHPSVKSVEALHGHNGASQVVFTGTAPEIRVYELSTADLDLRDHLAPEN
jgi:hypothetical protein